jgi:hypothetical protein
LLKSSTWGSSERGWDQWISRDLFMSVRLFNLMKKIKARGLDEATCGKLTLPDKDESVWINEKLQLIKDNRIPLNAEGTLPDEDAKWLREFIKGHSRSVCSVFDIEGVEKRFGGKLPKSYIEFITKVGPTSFENIDEQEGFTACVLAPDEFDAETYRAGALDVEDEEANAVDGVMFAKTEHGDCFCFDVQKGKKEFPILIFKHEYNCFEPYAGNFAACIKRFAGERDG